MARHESGLRLRTALCVAVALYAFAIPAIAGGGFIGEWDSVVNVDGSEYGSKMNVSEEDGVVKVSVVSDFAGEMETSNAKIVGDVLTFGLLVDALSTEPLEVTLKLEGGAISGALKADFDEYEMTATRVGGGSGGIAGTWNVVADVSGSEYPAVLTITGPDDDLKLVMEDDMNGETEGLDASFKDGVLSFSVIISMIGNDPLEVELTIDGDAIEGVIDAGDIGEIVLAGAKAGGSSGDDEAQLSAALETFKKGMENADVDVIATVLSDDFDSDEFGNKDGFVELLTMAFDSLEFKVNGVDLSEVKFEIDGDEATASSVIVDMTGEVASTNVFFKKGEDGSWRIIGMEEAGN